MKKWILTLVFAQGCCCGTPARHPSASSDHREVCAPTLDACVTFCGDARSVAAFSTDYCMGSQGLCVCRN